MTAPAQSRPTDPARPTRRLLICATACALAGALAGCGGQDVQVRPIGDTAGSRACLDGDQGQVCVEAGASGATSGTTPSGTSSGTGSATGSPAAIPAGRWGGGNRIGDFGSVGTATLTGAVAWSGKVTEASCDATNDIRVVEADLTSGRTLTVDVTTRDVATITLRTGQGVWTADWVNGADDAIALTPTATLVRQARLTGSGGTVVLDAEFDC